MGSSSLPVHRPDTLVGPPRFVRKLVLCLVWLGYFGKMLDFCVVHSSSPNRRPLIPTSLIKLRRCFFGAACPVEQYRSNSQRYIQPPRQTSQLEDLRPLHDDEAPMRSCVRFSNLSFLVYSSLNGSSAGFAIAKTLACEVKGLL